MVSGIIADIERFSTHDGPGIRTVVFFKGCPLRCAWCHNPECISFEPETLFYPEKCVHCGRCAQGCYTGAREECGREMDVSQVMEQILFDRDYYGREGGVTFSGGEPQCQPDLLGALIDACREGGITTAIETSMIVYHPELLKKLDLIMADVKVMDEEKHRAFTGSGNREILKNIQAADELGVPMIIHTPVIPDVNADRESILAIREFVKKLKNVRKYELLPYHPLGVDKGRAAGRIERRFSVPSNQLMKELQAYADL